jgi:hypothetical protein
MIGTHKWGRVSRKTGPVTHGGEAP